ncbi:hypothetical protein [Pseudanabaena sp. ABRG5-3]|uniref:hypothetical protein n=1 Tax=Pseudanabaena sp. ABRG5-3 TaxID=685565 RepID=UPI000DC6FAA0|nr:hypothetical protein [Pseudanabaena sp. ABRG5-3]BBC25056.1 hypothetical protein ABRG53_2799 [Pseudanabaena sp. ABRG5-3]
MKKMAIFVEGETELRFIDRLIREIANEKSLQIVLVKASGGGTRITRTYNVVYDSGGGSDKEFYIRIVNSGTDNRVGSDIRDNYAALMNSGFEMVIGVRDVYPDFSLSDLPKLRNGLRYRLRTKPVSVDFVLGVMEIEAWFLAEHTHFSRIHPRLSASRIAALYGFDPSIDDMQLRANPAFDLHNAYSLEGLAYKKTGSQIQRTVEALDYAEMYLEHKAKFPDFAVFMRVIDQFFS